VWDAGWSLTGGEFHLGPALLRRGILLGLGAAAPIGPVNVEIARRTLRGGFRPGFALGCGAVTVDVFYAALSSVSLREVINRPAVQRPVGIAAILILFYLAFLCFRGAIRTWRTRTDPLAPLSTPPARAVRGAYLTGFFMTLLNPMTLVFWFVAVPGVVGSVTHDPRRDLPLIGAGVFIGTLGWVVTFAGLLALVGRWRRNSWLAAADALGGVTLLCFALASLWSYTRQAL
jgi:L-lysine exporter family protein LysE/ArgO